MRLSRTLRCDERPLTPFSARILQQLDPRELEQAFTPAN